MPMRRISVFLIILLSGIASYAAVAYASATLLSQPQRTYGDMMSGMWGWSTPQATTQSPYANLIWFISITATAMAAVGATGLVYTVFRPEPAAKMARVLAIEPIKEVSKPTARLDEAPSLKQEDGAEAALKVLKPDELQIIEILRRNDNHYLQKWISKDAGMSRLQTHRVVTRLVERNLVTVTKSGNTNEVSLAPWLVGEKKQPG